MTSRQIEFVMRTVEERNIRFVRLWFTDVLGFLKSVAISPAELEAAFEEGIGFDGSSIEGYARQTESDMLAKPDPNTFSILPWRTEAPGAARMFCDIVMPDDDQAHDRSDVHTLVFSARGDDFSTGMDLSGLSQETDESLLVRFLAIEDLLARVWSSSCRTVAVVSGRAWGAAADLALACDLRLGQTNASFRFPGAQFGLVLGSRRLACRIGSDRARQIILHGATVKAEQALSIGMLHQLVDGFEPADLPKIQVDRETQRQIMMATRAADDVTPGALAQDRLALMASAQRPGLKDRMLQYLAGVQAAKQKS